MVMDVLVSRESSLHGLYGASKARKWVEGLRRTLRDVKGLRTGSCNYEVRSALKKSKLLLQSEHLYQNA